MSRKRNEIIKLIFISLLIITVSLLLFTVTGYSSYALYMIHKIKKGDTCIFSHTWHVNETTTENCAGNNYAGDRYYSDCVFENGEVEEIEVRNFFTPCFINLGQTYHIRFNEDKTVVVDPFNDGIGYFKHPYIGTNLQSDDKTTQDVHTTTGATYYSNSFHGSEDSDMSLFDVWIMILVFSLIPGLIVLLCGICMICMICGVFQINL